MDEIKSWTDMVERIQHLTEDEVKSLLNCEVARYNRSTIVLRLHQRYCSLRRDRERQEIARGEILM